METSSQSLRMAPSIALSKDLTSGLTAVPFHLACLANNHSFDYNTGGLQETIATLDESQIAWVGAGLTFAQAETARVYQFGETRLAVL